MLYNIEEKARIVHIFPNASKRERIFFVEEYNGMNNYIWRII